MAADVAFLRKLLDEKMAGSTSGLTTDWEHGGHTWCGDFGSDGSSMEVHRYPVRGAVPMAHDYTNEDYMESGTGLHAVKTLKGVIGIMRDGQIKPMETCEGGTRYSAGAGFYGRSMIEEDRTLESRQKWWGILRATINHRCDTGVVVEFDWRANRKAVDNAEQETKWCGKNWATRLKGGNHGKSDRWCFHPSNTQITALWVCSTWSGMAAKIRREGESRPPAFLIEDEDEGEQSMHSSSHVQNGFITMSVRWNSFRTLLITVS